MPVLFVCLPVRLSVRVSMRLSSGSAQARWSAGVVVRRRRGTMVGWCVGEVVRSLSSTIARWSASAMIRRRYGRRVVRKQGST